MMTFDARQLRLCPIQADLANDFRVFCVLMKLAGASVLDLL